MTKPTPRIECDLTALVPAGVEPQPAILAEARDRGERISARVLAAAIAVRELPDGFRIQLRDVPGLLLQVAEFVDLDRRCCAFLRHAVILEEGGGPIWLELTGPEGAKEAIAGDVARLLPPGLGS